METVSHAETPPAKKRRIPKACAACRSKKLACDEQKPCSRCSKAGIACVYFERPKDPHLQRIERIEDQLELLNHRLDSTVLPSHVQTSPSISHSIGSIATDPDANASAGWQSGLSVNSQGATIPIGERYRPLTDPPSIGKLVGFKLRQYSRIDVVAAGLATEADARLFYSTFFQGCDRFVPVFDANDTFDSVRARNNTLFDVIVIFGARATHGVLSMPHQRLYGQLREHTSDLVRRLTTRSSLNVPVEDIQALLVTASYSDSGGILCDIALQAALESGTLNRLDALFSRTASQSLQSSPIDHSLFVSARVCYYCYVLDNILSIDGGKPPTVTMQSSARRVRSLLAYPQRTTLDIRLFAQVELNALRADAHASLATNLDSAAIDQADDGVVKGAIVDLDLWLSEWESIVLSDASHAWALLTLHLRALTASGIENIALMTDKQRNVAFAAKGAAEQHLKLLLSDTNSNVSSKGVGTLPVRPYVANLRYAMEFVWAKNAFCVLIVLRLGILLGDPLDRLAQRLAEANEFLRELDKIGMGTNISYTRILAQTVAKCEKAINLSLQSEGERSSVEPGDFQTFIPKEFIFEWNFPGLHLCYIPLDWQELFLDFGTAV